MTDEEHPRELSMNAAEREWVLCVVELMCLAHSQERLDEISRAVAVDIHEKGLYISARALDTIKGCGAANRKHVEDLINVDIDVSQITPAVR